MKLSINDYRTCAKGIVDKMTNEHAWNSYLSANYWRLANAFTTLIDWYVIAGPSPSSNRIGQSTYHAFQSKTLQSDWWYDDYGWWIVACLRAAENSELVGFDEAKWRGLAAKAWNLMAKAKDAWTDAKPKPAEGKPRFEGGVWNHHVPPSPDPWDGIQNTVTNVQYLVCAARLSYHEEAKREWAWLDRWFSESDPSLPPNRRLLASYPGVGKLVRERVSTFAGGSPMPNYEKDRHWTGDQGILLGALLEMARLDLARRPNYYATAKAVLDGVKTKLVKGQILQPWTPPNTSIEGYEDDYSTGIGVFMRYLLYVHNNDTKDRELSQHIRSHYKGFIEANADHVCRSVGQCLLPEGKKMDTTECLLNQLAVLNAAIVISA